MPLNDYRETLASCKRRHLKAEQTKLKIFYLPLEAHLHVSWHMEMGARVVVSEKTN